MAAGRPVIAYRGGGALETVVEGETGVFFDSRDARSLEGAVRGFDAASFDPGRLRRHAEGVRRIRLQGEDGQPGPVGLDGLPAGRRRLGSPGPGDRAIFLRPLMPIILAKEGCTHGRNVD